MGVKAWFAAYFDDDPKKVLADGPRLDRDASRRFAELLLSGTALDAEADGDLQFLNPGKNEVFVGCYGGLRIVAHGDFGIDYPSKIEPRWYDPIHGSTVYVHATHNVADWLAFGLWRDGELVRSLSVSPDNGIQEQIGDRLPFEDPYWDGEFPVGDDDDSHPLPFHPLELAEASVLEHLGFQFEGHPDNWVRDPADVPIARFSIRKPCPR